MAETRKNKTTPLETSTRVLIVVAVFAAAVLVIFLTGLLLAGGPLLDQLMGLMPDPTSHRDPGLGGGWQDDPIFSSAVAPRQEEIIYYDEDAWNDATGEWAEGTNDFFQGMSDSATEGTDSALGTISSGVDLGMNWIGSFWKGATILFVIIGVSISVATAINVIEENYIVAAIIAIVLSGAFLVGSVGTYYLALDGYFLHLILFGALAAFFIFEGWGKTGYFSMLYGIMPAIVVTMWIWPDVWTLGGYGLWTTYADTISGWTAAIGV